MQVVYSFLARSSAIANVRILTVLRALNYGVLVNVGVVELLVVVRD